MRQAIVSIRDEDFAGSEEVISVFRTAELHDVDVVSCDWTGGVVRVHREEELDEQRLDEADTMDIVGSLTDRQHEALQTAHENGYYDVPRGITTNELAEELGVDGSPVSEHLQRAERNLITAALTD